MRRGRGKDSNGERAAKERLLDVQCLEYETLCSILTKATPDMRMGAEPWALRVVHLRGLITAMDYECAASARDRGIFRSNARRKLHEFVVIWTSV